MKILMQNRLDAFVKRGGDTTQMVKTADALRALGIDVDISLDYKPDVSNYDIVHIFNTVRVHETYIQFINAKSYKKPIVLSPVYQNFHIYNKYAAPFTLRMLNSILSKNWLELLKESIRTLKLPRQILLMKYFINPGFLCMQRDVLTGADILLPQTVLEWKSICNDFALDPDRIKFNKVVNGIDFNRYDKEVQFSPDDHLKDLRSDEFVLCAARIEPMKNQLNLINALKSTDLKLVLVGDINPNYKAYAKSVLQKLAEVGGVYLGFAEADKLLWLYLHAKVHVLASWFETCGLSNLEAGYLGCNIVSTDIGFAVEYFKDYAWYCKPDDLVSIRSAVLSAFNSPVNPTFRKFIQDNYSWQNAAEQTLSAYEDVLLNKKQIYKELL